MLFCGISMFFCGIFLFSVQKLAILLFSSLQLDEILPMAPPF